MGHVAELAREEVIDQRRGGYQRPKRQYRPWPDDQEPVPASGLSLTAQRHTTGHDIKYAARARSTWHTRSLFLSGIGRLFHSWHATATPQRSRSCISATQAHHAVSTITSANWQQLGEVTNEVQPIINNGVLVTVGSGSVWSVTGTCYLSKLDIAADAAVTGAGRGRVTMTVDGTATAIMPGQTYTGAIVLTVS